MTQADAKKAILKIWMQRPDGTRRERDMMLFEADIEQDHPELLSFRCAGDPWQEVKIFLQDHLEDQ